MINSMSILTLVRLTLRYTLLFFLLQVFAKIFVYCGEPVINRVGIALDDVDFLKQGVSSIDEIVDASRSRGRRYL